MDGLDGFSSKDIGFMRRKLLNHYGRREPEESAIGQRVSTTVNDLGLSPDDVRACRMHIERVYGRQGRSSENS